MKTATALLRSAESQGIILWVEGGHLRYKARQPVSDGFKDRIKEHRAEIIKLLSRGETDSTPSTLPEWCDTRCEHYHRLDLPVIGTMQWCCWEKDERHWRRDRIDGMGGCPMVKQR